MNNPTSRRSGGPSQTDVVAEGIKDMILSVELRPGSRLPVEKDLADSGGHVSQGVHDGCRRQVDHPFSGPSQRSCESVLSSR